MAVPVVVRVVDGWVPLPDHLLAALGWAEGTPVSAEVVDGTLILTPAPEVGPPARPTPAKGRRVEGSA